MKSIWSLNCIPASLFILDFTCLTTDKKIDYSWSQFHIPKNIAHINREPIVISKSILEPYR